jgi:hypothetical protein
VDGQNAQTLAEHEHVSRLVLRTASFLSHDSVDRLRSRGTKVQGNRRCIVNKQSSQPRIVESIMLLAVSVIEMEVLVLHTAAA